MDGKHSLPLMRVARLFLMAAPVPAMPTIRNAHAVVSGIGSMAHSSAEKMEYAAAAKAAENHRLAAQKFAEAQAAYKAIADRNKNSGDVAPGTFDGTSTKQLKPGE